MKLFLTTLLFMTAIAQVSIHCIMPVICNVLLIPDLNLILSFRLRQTR